MRGALGCGSSEAGTDLPTGCRPFDSFRHRTTPNRTQKIHLTTPPTAAVSFARTRAAPKSQTPTVPRHPQEKLRCYRASSPSKPDRGSRLRCWRKLTDGSRYSSARIDNTGTDYRVFGLFVSMNNISTGLVPKFFSDRVSP